MIPRYVFINTILSLSLSPCCYFHPNAQAQLEDDLASKVAKFEKRLEEKDPVSGAPRYGESMTAKVGTVPRMYVTTPDEIRSNLCCAYDFLPPRYSLLYGHCLR